MNRKYIGNHEKLNYQPYIDELYHTSGVEGFVYKNYCVGGSERQYFSDENGKKIDAVRQKIGDWKTKKEISDNLYYFLLASLLEKADAVANTASICGAYLKHLKKSAQKVWTSNPHCLMSMTMNTKFTTKMQTN